jgi:hypothetical protein
MSNPYNVGDKVLVSSGMSKKLVGLTGEVMYIDGEFCEVALEDRKDYDRLHYLALRYEDGDLTVLLVCGECDVAYKANVMTDDLYCPECDLKRGAETLKGFPDAPKPRPLPKEQFTKGCRAEDKAILPEDAQARKEIPVYSGVYCYFPKMIDCLRKNNINMLSYPRALCAISHQSWIGNQQHHPDKPLHWDKTKSTDNEDAFLRHWIEGDLIPALWRAFAVCERILDSGGKVRRNYEGCHSDLNLNYSLTHKQWFDVLLYTLTRLEKELEK